VSDALASCRGVTVVHGRGEASVTALENVELEIARGEQVGLTGRSGSGKTTLLHVLGGLIAPSSGGVVLEGRPLSSLDASARAGVRAGRVAYVFQGANLLPTFTAFENVSFALHVAAGAEGHTGAADARGPDEQTRELLGLVGLAEKLDSLPAELSGGEAQRVAIARALAQRPLLLLCDEPTGHLDSDTGGRVLDLVWALQGELGFALVLATHDADAAARAERVVTLEDGRVVSEEVFA
jgi:putative ABC transport system ATP-binding protein